MYGDVVCCPLNENGMLIRESRYIIHKVVFSAMEAKNLQTNKVKGCRCHLCIAFGVLLSFLSKYFLLLY